MKSNIFYLTFGEHYGGIYQGQVIDVVDLLRLNLGSSVRLVSFVPLTGFLKHKNKIKKKHESAIVVPMMPFQGKWLFWKMNCITLAILCFFYKTNSIMARNPFACYLALNVKRFCGIKKICYDGRGGVKYESEEYKIYPLNIHKQIPEIEGLSVLKSDFLITVNEDMVGYWAKEFNYKGDRHLIIPITLSSHFKIENKGREERRKELGFSKSDIVLVYSGSVDKWQSIDMLVDMLKKLMIQNYNVKILFLSKVTNDIEELLTLFPKRVMNIFVNPKEVPSYLLACDYGLLIRVLTKTNKLTTSTKFAEYLAVGLSVIVSKGMFISNFIREMDCGFVINNEEGLQCDLSNLSTEHQNRNKELAQKYFKKDSELNSLKYLRLIKELAE